MEVEAQCPVLPANCVESVLRSSAVVVERDEMVAVLVVAHSLTSMNVLEAGLKEPGTPTLRMSSLEGDLMALGTSRWARVEAAAVAMTSSMGC